MEDAAGTIAVVDQGGLEFCPACQRYLELRSKLGEKKIQALEH